MEEKDSLLEGSAIDSRYGWSSKEAEEETSAPRTTGRSSSSIPRRGGSGRGSMDRYEATWKAKGKKKVSPSSSGPRAPVGISCEKETVGRPSKPKERARSPTKESATVVRTERSGLKRDDEIGLSFLLTKEKTSAPTTTHNRTDSKAKTERLKKRNEEIKEGLLSLKRAQQIDLCILMDCTGSMQSWIDICHKSISSVLNVVRERFSMLRVRIAFVGYRDHCDGGKRLQVFPFSRDLVEFQNFVSSIRAEGGGDGPEDLLGGLHEALSLDWENETRVLVHIADYPCHGSWFHDFGPGEDDYHAKPEPHKLRAEDLLTKVVQLRLHYYFGKILTVTDKMIQVFNTMLTERLGQPIATLDVGKLEDFIPKVADTISESISIESRSALKGAGKALKPVAIHPAEPNWSDIEVETVKVFYFKLPDSIPDALEHSLRLEQKFTKVKIASHPFAQGACRLAYYMVETKYSNPRELVAKESKFSGVGYNTKAGYLADMEAQTLATLFAKEFNNTFKMDKTVKFTKVRLFSFFQRKSPRYMATEPRIKGLYVKYNNNAGYTSSTNYHAILEAFSHWTWCASNKELIIVDLQGVNETLTDPAIHHRRHVDRYGGTNLGKAGIDLFFTTHKCNRICEKLGLERHERQPSTEKELDDELAVLH